MFAKNLSAGFGQIRQLASETLGTADPECITELPVEYTSIESKVEKVKNLYETFLRLSKNLAESDYNPTAEEAIKGLTGKFNEMMKPGAAPSSDKPATLAHAFAKAAMISSNELGDHEPLGAALKKLADAEEKIGNARLTAETSINANFIQPWSATLNKAIVEAQKERRIVQSARLKLDAAKSALKNAKPDKVAPAQMAMQSADEELVLALQSAIQKMKVVVDSPEPLKNLSAFVSVQLQYFKEGFEVLSELAPEVDELQVTQEALFRSS